VKIDELYELTEKVNTRIDALWSDCRFSGDPPKVTVGVCQVIIEEYINQMRENNGKI